MTALPDPDRSRAVLIGASTYSHLENLPAIHNNLTVFRDVLINPALGGLPADKCTVLEEPPSGLVIYQVLREAGTAAEDTLLVYFSGHGRTGERNELYLCLPDTDPDVLSFTALAYNDLRKAVADSRATKKVVILDCCFSGRALADLGGDDETVVGQVGIEGSYILTATPANAVALAPPGERNTAFTGALLDLLRTGIPGGRELLTFSEIYPRLKYTLTSRQLPQPRQRGSDTIAHLALTRNPAHVRHAATARPTSHSPTSRPSSPADQSIGPPAIPADQPKERPAAEDRHESRQALKQPTADQDGQDAATAAEPQAPPASTTDQAQIPLVEGVLPAEGLREILARSLSVFRSTWRYFRVRNGLLCLVGLAIGVGFTVPAVYFDYIYLSQVGAGGAWRTKGVAYSLIAAFGYVVALIMFGLARRARRRYSSPRPRGSH